MRCVGRKNILLKQNTNSISNHIAYRNSFFFCTQLRDERRISFYWHNHNIVHPHFQELIVRWCIQAASTNDISITFQVFSYSSSFDIENTVLPAIQTGYLLTNRAVLASFIQIPLYYFLFTKCTRLTQTVTFQ